MKLCNAKREVFALPNSVKVSWTCKDSDVLLVATELDLINARELAEEILNAIDGAIAMGKRDGMRQQ